MLSEGYASVDRDPSGYPSVSKEKLELKARGGPGKGLKS
jgi:hypothetical protein